MASGDSSSQDNDGIQNDDTDVKLYNSAPIPSSTNSPTTSMSVPRECQSLYQIPDDDDEDVDLDYYGKTRRSRLKVSPLGT